MRRLALILLLFPAAAARGQESELERRYVGLERRAFDHFAKKEWTQAIALFEKQAALFSGNPRPFYNVACCYALQAEADRAATWLRLAVAHGWRDLEWTRTDEDFDLVKRSDVYLDALTHLRAVLVQDPDPLPREVDPLAAPEADSVDKILAAFRIQSEAMDTTLLEEGQIRRRLFPVLDRERAALTRYILEHADTPDADMAGYALLGVAGRYLERAERDSTRDRALVAAATSLVHDQAGEFYRRWPASKHLPAVRLLDAQALLAANPPRRGQAIEILRGLVEDFPDHDAAPQALMEICRLEADAGDMEKLRGDWKLLNERWSESLWVKMGLAMGHLAKPRLAVQGMPRDPVGDSGGTALAPFEGGGKGCLFVFVSSADEQGPAKIAALREAIRPYDDAPLLPMLLCIDDPARDGEESIAKWLQEQGDGFRAVPDAREYLRSLEYPVRTLPLVILTTGTGDVLAIDPDPKQLGRMLAELLKE